MEEVYINDRYKSLQRSVVMSFDGMITDGLAKQLQKHPTSYQFASRRLTEVLDDYVTKDREEFIQKVLEDINELTTRKDRITDKLTRTVENIKSESTKTAELNKNLKIQRQDLTSKLEKLEIEKKDVETSLNTTLNITENMCNRSIKGIDEVYRQITELKGEFNTLRRLFNNKQKECRKMIENTNKTIQQQVDELTYKETVTNEFDPTINQKKNEIEQITRQNNRLKYALEGAYQNYNAILQSDGNSAQLKEDFSNLGDNINKYIEKQQESVVKKHFAAAKSQLKNVNMDSQRFASSVAELYRQKLLAKEREYDEVIRAARFRRAELKASLKAASAQLEQMKLHTEQEDMLISEMMQRRNRIESSKSVLDQAFSKLGL